MSLNITSYDPDQLKESLIEFFSTRQGFTDFNYEGSAISTIIDLLVRNTHYIAYMANMVATESFLDSAQLRSNIVSHAQKLSYTPRSRTASTIVANLTVKPTTPALETSITCDKNSSFIYSIDGTTYSFTNTSDVVLVKSPDGFFKAIDVELKQGLLNTQKFIYNASAPKIELANKDIDTSTLKVYVRSSQTATVRTEYAKPKNITDITQDSAVYFLSENSRGTYDIEFGKGVLGTEPLNGSIVEVEYVVVELEHANNLDKLIAASPISDYSDIQIDVTTAAYGGAEKTNAETIKFLAPRVYEAQERAVRETDFAALASRDFPFIKSVIAWGGEKNDPPSYGRVFISAIPHDGYVIADKVKTNIQDKMREYSMMTTVVVDVDYIDVDLVIRVMYDQNKSSKTFEQLRTDITNTIKNYKEDIKLFERWYNDTELRKRIEKDNPVVYSIESDIIFSKTVKVVPNTTQAFETKFVNRLVPGSISVLGVKANNNGKVHTITDKNGKMVLDDGITVSEVGDVDYEKGYIKFISLQLGSNDLVIKASPVSENVYTARNFVININNIVVNRLLQ